MRAVLDTNVVVSGLLWKTSPRQVLDAARERGIVSGDPHLLNLKHYQHILIINPAEAVRLLVQ